jgi:uncharacterized protein YkwD
MRQRQPVTGRPVSERVMGDPKPMQRLSALLSIALPLQDRRGRLGSDPRDAKKPGRDRTIESPGARGTCSIGHAGAGTSRRTLLRMLGAGAMTTIVAGIGRHEIGEAKNGKRGKPHRRRGKKRNQGSNKTRGQRASPGSSSLITGCASPEAVEMLGHVNAWRAENGVAPLALDGVLLAAAQTKSSTMASTGVFAHDVAGVSPAQNLANHGAPITAFGGENLGKGHETVQEVFIGWKTSPGHNANLLRSESKTLGVAVVRVQETQVVDGHSYPYATAYWTQVFGNQVVRPAAC